VIDDLLALILATRANGLLIVTGIICFGFACLAFFCDWRGHKIISPFFAAGAWLCAAFGALIWFWR
jgi:hypothetical protein